MGKGAYGVKLVRGPFIDLEAHPNHCDSVEALHRYVADLRAADPAVVLAADLFAGAGGLSLGLEQAGMKVVLSADHYAEAVKTHQHHFGGLAVDWDLSDVARVEQIATIMRELQIDVLAGGPPCQPFSKAGRSGIRYRVMNGLRDPHDQRRDLWRAYLEVARLAKPRAVIMENVPDMALDREMFILRAMVEELETLGYAVEERVVETWRYGVPQFRQRLIMVALRDGLSFDWPAEAGQRTTVWEAIGDLPPVEGGFRPEGGADGYQAYDGPVSRFQAEMRESVAPEHEDRVYDHITRPVRPDDAQAFENMDSKTKYSDLDEEFRRYRHDIFDDKYKRLDEDDLSRTITAHIAKDGYWYIHPRQHRTLTVREAARLQTFPDHYRFNGPPSAAFKQIGNAVPPKLGRALGRAVMHAFESKQPAGWSSQSLSRRLSDWYASRSALRLPWLATGSVWSAMLGESLFERSDMRQVEASWPFLKSLDSPGALLEVEGLIRGVAAMLGREDRAAKLLDLAKQANQSDVEDADAWLLGRTDVGETLRQLLLLVAHRDDGEMEAEPILQTRGVLRPVGRYWGNDVERRNSRTDGRLAVARVVGAGPTAQGAHLALIEIAQGVCRPQRPLCADCPLAAECAEAAELRYEGVLF